MQKLWDLEDLEDLQDQAFQVCQEDHALLLTQEDMVPLFQVTPSDQSPHVDLEVLGLLLVQDSRC